MGIQRVWLSSWEWACCGDEFAVGDSAQLSVDRGTSGWLTELIGTDLGASVDAIETHHEEVGAEMLRGRVVSIVTVAVPYEFRRLPRPVLPQPTLPTPRFESLDETGTGFIATFGASAWVTVSEPVPGPPTVEPISQVPWPRRDAVDAPDDVERPTSEHSEELAVGIQNVVVGYLVELGMPD